MGDPRPRSGLSCDVSSSSSGQAPKCSPSLPSKVYDCKSKVVLLQEFLQAGVVEIQGGEGKLAYCFFQVLPKPKRLKFVSQSEINIQIQSSCGAGVLRKKLHCDGRPV